MSADHSPGTSVNSTDLFKSLQPAMGQKPPSSETLHSSEETDDQRFLKRISILNVRRKRDIRQERHEMSESKGGRREALDWVEGRGRPEGRGSSGGECAWATGEQVQSPEGRGASGAGMSA